MSYNSQISWIYTNWSRLEYEAVAHIFIYFFLLFFFVGEAVAQILAPSTLRLNRQWVPLMRTPGKIRCSKRSWNSNSLSKHQSAAAWFSHSAKIESYHQHIQVTPMTSTNIFLGSFWNQRRVVLELYSHCLYVIFCCLIFHLKHPREN